MSTTSRVRVYMACSIDGFIAGPDDDLSWLSPPAGVTDVPPPTEALEFDGFIAQVGCMLMGRRTHDVVAGFGDWAYGDLPVLVPTHRPLHGAAPTVRAVSGTIEQLIDSAKQVAGDKDVYLDGGNLIRQALDADLVDEMVITTVPTLLAGGTSLFEGLTKRSAWTFVEHHTYGHMLQVTMRSVR